MAYIIVLFFVFLFFNGMLALLFSKKDPFGKYFTNWILAALVGFFLPESDALGTGHLVAAIIGVLLASFNWSLDIVNYFKEK